MSMTIDTRRNGFVSVLDLSGRLTLGDGTDQLRATVKQQLDEGNKNILLNMAGVSYIDSAGLGELVALYTHTTRREGQLKLVALSGRFVDLLQLTKLHTVFDIFDNEAMAVLSYG